MEQTGEREERVMRLRKKKTFMDQATDFAESLLPTLETAAHTAREKAGPLIQDARDRAVPLLNEARENAAPLLAQGRSLAAEKAAQASAIAAERAATGRDLAQARLAELNGEAPKKRHRLRKLVLLGAVAGLGAVAYKKVNGDDGWQASYAPEPPPAAPPKPSSSSSSSTAAPAVSTPAAPTVEAVIPTPADDAAGASPDEAMSDAVETPHEATDPDHPADVVSLTGETEAPTTADEAASKSTYGPGSALPLAGGASPDPAYTIKGNADSMLFHTTESPWFNRTIAEVWFTDERAAEAAGFRHWRAPKD